MTLGEKQRLFMRLLPRLLDKAHELGFEVTLGDGYRDPRAFGALGVQQGYGHAKSNHKQRLAIDLNLFQHSAYLPDTESHRPLGTWWELQHELCRWGGRFGAKDGRSGADGNHYSLEHDGLK